MCSGLTGVQACEEHGSAATAARHPPSAPRPPSPRPAAPPPPLLARCHLLRRIAGKAHRKLRALAGNPLRTPWIMRPAHTDHSTAFVDVLVAMDYLSPNSTLAGLLQQALGARGMSFLLVNDTNVEAAIRQLDTGWLKPYVVLDLCSAVNARYFDLLQSAASAGSYAIGNPRTLLNWTLKSNSHGRLETAGLPLPPTIIFRRDEADRELSQTERKAIGDHCVIKPAWGVGGRGCMVGMEPTAANITMARDYNRDDDWLVQKQIRWTRCGSRPGYLRAYNIFGGRTLLWWCKEHGIDRYDLLSQDDLDAYDLMPAVALVDRLGEITGMDFFSTEIAITAEPSPGRLCLIDYVNDQCDMDPDERPGTTPVPLPFVQWACGQFAQFAWSKKHAVAMNPERSLTLFEREVAGDKRPAAK